MFDQAVSVQSSAVHRLAVLSLLEYKQVQTLAVRSIAFMKPLSKEGMVIIKLELLLEICLFSVADLFEISLGKPL